VLKDTLLRDYDHFWLQIARSNRQPSSLLGDVRNPFPEDFFLNVVFTFFCLLARFRAVISGTNPRS